MQSQFTMFWNDPNVKGITYLGLHRRLDLAGEYRPHDQHGTMRPAMTWLMDFLGNR